MNITHTRLLVVDDEKAIRRFLRVSLEGHGFTIFEATNGQEAIQSITEDRPDLVILDLGLPDLDGIEITRRVREWSQIPIIILSVRDQEKDKIAALDSGADDYLVKPFGVGELMARIRVALRRTNLSTEEPVFQMRDLKVDFVRRMVSFKDTEINLTPTEYDLLRLLVQKAGKVITHRQMLRQIWGTSYESETHLLRVNISNLRRKIEPDPSQPEYLLTEPGVGYRLKTTD
jgi:two-component system KDP operon response regulator KdpE